MSHVNYALDILAIKMTGPPHPKATRRILSNLRHGKHYANFERRLEVLRGEKFREYSWPYFASESGKVLNFMTLALMTQSPSNWGYLQVSVCGGSISVHRLVALAFIPNPMGKKTVNHKDGNKLNNSVSNLEWATQSEQQKHALATGLSPQYGARHHQAKLTNPDVQEIIRLLESGMSQSRVGEIFNVSRVSVRSIWVGETWGWLTKRG